MRAIVLHEAGPAENLRLQDWDRPPIVSGHAILRVRAVGVCYRDIIDRRGDVPFMKWPVVPGHEFAGEIVEVGEGVRGFAVGDRVVNLLRAPCGICEYCKAGDEPRCIGSAYAFGTTADGGYAELVSVPVSGLVKLPEAIPFEKGCFLACTAAMSLRGLRRCGQLRAGQTVLVTGASGGVGAHAVQVARNLGARVIAVTSSEAKVAALKQLGADEVLVSADLKFHSEVRALSNGGVHVAFDCVGTPTLNSALRSLRPTGRLVVAGNVTTERVQINPGLVILSELTFVGSSGCTRDDLREVLRWVEDGKLEPQLGEVLPLEQAVEAHRRLESRSVTGRLVLRP